MRRLKRDTRIEERAAVIIELLSEHGDVSPGLQTVITEQTDLLTLRQWCHIAANSKNAEDFEEKIHQLR